MSQPIQRYRIRHLTRYKYSDSVAICQNQLRMQPQSVPGVTCHASKVTIEPTPESDDEHVDYYGNRVHTFAIESLHHDLEVLVESDVTVTPRPIDVGAPSTPWETIRDTVATRRDADQLIDEYCYASPRVILADAYREYAATSFAPGRGIVDAALDLTGRIHAEFKYDSSATDVGTPVAEAFEKRAGVCQDFAHIEIACLRSLGLPARYVSGYLRTLPPPGKTRLVGADQSHAWVSVFSGQPLGWIECDPTNACFAGADHIPIGYGRDYGDVSPMRGVVTGGGITTLQVNVDVEPVE